MRNKDLTVRIIGSFNENICCFHLCKEFCQVFLKNPFFQIGMAICVWSFHPYDSYVCRPAFLQPSKLAWMPLLALHVVLSGHLGAAGTGRIAKTCDHRHSHTQLRKRIFQFSIPQMIRTVAHTNQEPINQITVCFQRWGPAHVTTVTLCCRRSAAAACRMKAVGSGS